MRSIRGSRRALAGMLALALLLILIAPRVLPNVSAQTAVPTATPAPVPTPEPTKTLPQLLDTLIKGDTPVQTTGELFNRYGIAIALGLLAIVIGVIVLLRYLNGLSTAVEDIGKEHGSRVLRWSPRSNADRYLDWLVKRCATIRPLGIGGEHVTLDVARVHVPLRFEEAITPDQAGHQKSGALSGEEFIQRPGRLRRLGRSDHSYVFTLLSEPKLLLRAGRPNALQREQAAIARRFGRQQPVRVSDESETIPTVTNRLLILGRAGSGKTTTLRYAALRLADAYRRRKPRLLADANMRLYLPKTPLPIYARLTEFVRWLPNNQRTPPTTEQFLAWLDQTARDGCGDGTPALSRFVADGRALLLIDGLDEAGDEARRADLAALITTLAETYQGNRYIVASRAGYGGNVRLDTFNVVQLSGLNEDEAKKLLVNWFTAVKDARPLAQADKLWGAVQPNRRLSEMATNPLLLTVMAALHYKETELPNERAALYEKLIELLLGLWRRHQLDAEAAYEDWNVDRLRDERNNIEDLALLMQMRPAEQATEVTLEQAQEWLYQRYTPGMPPNTARMHVAALLNVLELQCGLLRQDHASIFAFTHYSFQEYLAACALDDLHKQRSNRDVDFLLERADDPHWRETLLLAAGRWSSGRDLDKAERLIRSMLDRQTLDALLLAGEALADIRAEKKLPQLRDQAAAKLRSYAFDPSHCPDPAARNRTATLLDRLDADNDRPGLKPTSEDYWIDEWIAPGVFHMGDVVEEPAFDYTIRRSYKLARYPVTNRQYEEFLKTLDDQQFEQHRPAYWPGRRYRAGEGNYPVVSVRWSSAMIFAAWADKTLRERGILKLGEIVRLPTEPEWERAAAYPIRIPTGATDTGRREYPWGAWPEAGPHPPTPAPNLGAGESRSDGGKGDGIPANIGKSGIGSTSVVGIFPHGAAACGAQDLAGNVWEWCCTLYQPYPLPEELEPESLYSQDTRRTFVLRGGACGNDRSYARCAYRNQRPDDRRSLIGLRLARLFSS